MLKSSPPNSPNSPYRRPVRVTEDEATNASLFLRNYQEDIKARKAKLKSLYSPKLTEEEIKRIIYDIRHMTLAIIESGLEIEYQHNANKIVKSKKLRTLLPILRYSASNIFEEKSNCFVLNDMISDNHEIFKIPHIKAILTLDSSFPIQRNPFFLGKHACALMFSSLLFTISNL